MLRDANSSCSSKMSSQTTERDIINTQVNLKYLSLLTVPISRSYQVDMFTYLDLFYILSNVNKHCVFKT